MPYTNVGRQIGTSKVKGLISKYDSEGSDMKLWKFGDFLKGSEPFITKDINTGEPFDRDTWVRMYVNNSSMAARKRIEDTARITKFVASPRGVLWEADMAALEAIQKDSTLKQQKRLEKIQSSGNPDNPKDFWKSLGSNLLSTAVNLGKSALQGIGLTAATLVQVAASGTGFHNDTYISRAYMTDGSSTLNQILSYAGLTTGGGINGAAAVLGGATNVLGDEPWKKLPDEKKMVPEDRATEGFHKAVQTYGMKSPGSSTPSGVYEKNYQGKRIQSSSFADNELRGVSATSKESRVIRGPKEAGVILADRENLKLSRYGRRIDREELFNEKYVSWYSSLKSTERAQDYDNIERNTLLKSAVNIGLSKNIAYRGDSIAQYHYGLKDLFPDPVGNDLEFKSEKVETSLGLIPFCITTITPDHRTYLNFPAYLDSYDDSYDGEWESVRYIGRAENFYGYKGFKRSINLSFMVIAQNVDQLEPIYKKLNRLVGATAPSYGDGGVFMRGTLASLTIGGVKEGALLKEQLGFIPNVKLAWETDIPWEINSLEDISKEHDEKETKFVVPHALKVSMTFTPIEKQEVREDYGGYFVFDGEEKSYTEPGSDVFQKAPLTREEGGGGQAYLNGGAGYSGGGWGGGGRGPTPADTVPRVVGGTTGASSVNAPTIWQLHKIAFGGKKKSSSSPGGGR